jgi:dTDP-4-dehydrorhamnose reductase
MKILVTGAGGQVGFCLVSLLANSTWNYLALTKDQLDISDEFDVVDVVSRYGPDIIINAAAYTAVDRAESNIESAYNVNSKGAENLAIAAHKNGAAIFHISTDYVFSGDSQHPYLEEDLVDPQSVYGKSKLKAEQLVSAANPSHIILRTAWVFCEHGANFVKTMVRLGRDRDQLGVVSDQIGGPTYAGDIAHALLKMAKQYEEKKSLSWGIYHFSGYPHVSWFEFAKEIFHQVKEQNIYAKELPLLKSITTVDYPTPAQRPKNSRLNCNKIQRNFAIETSDWKQALKNIKAYV